jgi:DNA polymerase III sliding clamp (beta) subunit (PCNA family)
MKDLINTIIKASECSSKDETRDSLCGVNIRPTKNGKLTVEACNSYIMTQIKLDNPFNINEPIFIPNESIKILKTSKNNLIGPLEIMQNSIKIGNLWIPIVINSNFPNLDQLYPKINPTTQQLAIDAELLLKLAKSLVETKSKGVVLSYQGPSLPILVEPIDINDAENKTGVLMPIRFTKRS